MPDPARLAAARHLKRASRLVREAQQEVARAGDVDTIGHVTVRGTDDLDQARDLIQVALAEHREVDVIVVASIPRPR